MQDDQVVMHLVAVQCRIRSSNVTALLQENVTALLQENVTALLQERRANELRDRELEELKRREILKREEEFERIRRPLQDKLEQLQLEKQLVEEKLQLQESECLS